MPADLRDGPDTAVGAVPLWWIAAADRYEPARVEIPDTFHYAMTVWAEHLAYAPRWAFERIEHDMPRTLARHAMDYVPTLELQHSSIRVESNTDYEEFAGILVGDPGTVRHMPNSTTYTISGLTTTGTPVTVTTSGRFTVRPGPMTNSAAVTYSTSGTVVDYYVSNTQTGGIVGWTDEIRAWEHLGHIAQSSRYTDIPPRAAWEPTPLTPEQLAEREARRAQFAEREAEREAEYRRRRAAERRAWEAATARATELLRSLLSPDQCAELDDHGTITVAGSHGNRFRLGTTTAEGNVDWLGSNGQARGRMCAHPRQYDLDGERIPLPDILAGQVLALQTDERAFVEVANPMSGLLPTYDRAA